MIQIDMEMPKCCDECFALDDHGDYPYCLISQDQRGYTFNVRENRMPSCPLKAQEPITGETSDGYHTFNELYHHRAVLFSVIVANYPERAWKSKKHHDGTMYDGMFIVGIDTPTGQATYHYDIDPYWDMFACKVLENAPEWDGHTPAQAIERIGKLKAQEPRVMTVDEVREWVGKQRVDREPICVEVKDNICAWIVSDEYWDMQMDINLSSDLYGKTWRCWTSSPTDAQREATPWQTPSINASAPNG